MNKIILSDNGTLSDYSNALSSYYSTAKAFEVVGSQDALYIGSRVPFANLYLKLGTVSSAGVTLSVSYWSDEWEPVVELIDGTNGLTQSGHISFVPNKESAWEKESTNHAGESVAGLENLVIYDRYWIKVSFSGNASAGTTLKWVGNKFADDNDLGAKFPDLVRSNVLTSFKSGKTDWEEQHIAAARLIEEDLIDKGYIKGAGQIINLEDVREAAIQKCAEIVYRSFGTDYVDRAQECREEYLRRLEKRFVSFDQNMNAIQDNAEVAQSTGWLSR